MTTTLNNDARLLLSDIVGRENISDVFTELPSIHLQTYADVSSNKIALTRNQKFVIRPSTIEQIRDVLRVSRANKIPVVPLGGATTFYNTGGPVTTEKESIVIDLRRMNQILELDEIASTVTVRPCVTIDQLNRFLERKNLHYPHHPESRITATVGGAISINGISPLATKYGRPNDQVVAMKVMLADGEIYEIGNKTSFDNVFRLKGLFFGTEGSLGIIVEITLKVYPIPEARIMGLFGFKEPAHACEALRKIADSGIIPEAVMIPEKERIYNEALLPLLSTVDVSEILEDNELFVLVVHAGDKELVDFTMKKTDDIIRTHGGTRVQDRRVVDSYWDNLTQIGAVITPQMAATYKGQKYNSIRGGIPIGALPAFTKAVKKAFPSGTKLINAGITSYVFFPHLDVLPICGVLLDDTDGESVAQFNEFKAKVCKLSKDFNGTISATGAIGTFLRGMTDSEMKNSRKIADIVKGALDPEYLMNPGKMF